MIETARLLLRPWRDDDRPAFARLCADPDVMDWLGGVLNREQSDAYIDRMIDGLATRGFCRWAVERTNDGALIGACGLMPVLAGGPEGMEIGWRLARAAWGQGYATEAAKAALHDAFGRCGLGEVLTYTAAPNLKSQAVMGRLGFRRDPARDFDAMGVPEGPMRRQIMFALAANDFQAAWARAHLGRAGALR